MTAGPFVGQMLDFTNRFYRLTFMFSCTMATVGVVLGLIVHTKFMKLGGPNGYVAPE
jgi:hypothetical protein